MVATLYRIVAAVAPSHLAFKLEQNFPHQKKDDAVVFQGATGDLLNKILITKNIQPRFLFLRSKQWPGTLEEKSRLATRLAGRRAAME